MGPLGPCYYVLYHRSAPHLPCTPCLPADVWIGRSINNDDPNVQSGDHHAFSSCTLWSSFSSLKCILFPQYFLCFLNFYKQIFSFNPLIQGAPPDRTAIFSALSCALDKGGGPWVLVGRPLTDRRSAPTGAFIRLMSNSTVKRTLLLLVPRPSVRRSAVGVFAQF